MRHQYSNCPKCHSPLTQEEMPFVRDDYLYKTKKTDARKGKIWKKSCNRHLNHTFSIIFDINSEMTISTHISLPVQKSFIIYSWYFADQKLQLNNDSSNNSLPWFEPDFKDWNKLINKLKTYTLFL